MKKSLLLFLLITITLLSTCIYATTLSDIGGHWAESHITKLVDKGVVVGYPDGTYKPEGTVTKAEFMKLIMTASIPTLDYKEVQGNFTHWAGQHIQVAKNYDVIAENEMDEENIEVPITRMQVVEILSKCDIGIRENTQRSTILEFTDIAEITDEQKVLLRHAVSSGIIGGYPNGTFGPERTLTRAETAKIISVYIGD